MVAKFNSKVLEKFWWVFLIVLSLPAVWSLTVPGFYGASDDLHIGWLHQMDKVIKLGQIPPRFVPDLSYGFGYPLFNFVFPLPFYFGEIFHLIGFSLVDSVKIVFGLSLIFSAMTMFLLLRNFSSFFLSLAGAILYLYTPYRSTEVYIRGAFGEALTFVFLPLITLSVFKLTDPKIRGITWVGIGGLSLGALVFSHNITSYMFFPFLGLLIFIRFYFVRGNLKIILRTIGSLILGILVSLYFWLPALVDSKLMKFDTVFNFIDHFPTLKQLITPYFGYGASVPGPYDGMSFFIGLVNLVVLIFGLILLIKFWKEIDLEKKLILIWALFTFSISIFMMNFRSSFIWSSIPLISYFQFPWRFLILTTFVTPLFLIAFPKLKWEWVAGVLIIVFVIALNFSYFKPHDFLGRTDDYYINRYIPSPIASEEYKMTQEEYLRLPSYTQTRPDRNYPAIGGGGDADIKETEKVNELDVLVKTSADHELTVFYYKYFFPGWYATLNGKEIEVKPAQPFGQISIDIPKGDHTLFIGFSETKFKLLLDLISIVSLIIAVLLLINSRIHLFSRLRI